MIITVTGRPGVARRHQTLNILSLRETSLPIAGTTRCPSDGTSQVMDFRPTVGRETITVRPLDWQMHGQPEKTGEMDEEADVEAPRRGCECRHGRDKRVSGARAAGSLRLVGTAATEPWKRKSTSGKLGWPFDVGPDHSCRGEARQSGIEPAPAAAGSCRDQGSSSCHLCQAQVSIAACRNEPPGL